MTTWTRSILIAVTLFAAACGSGSFAADVAAVTGHTSQPTYGGYGNGGYGGGGYNGGGYGGGGYNGGGYNGGGYDDGTYLRQFDNPNGTRSYLGGDGNYNYYYDGNTGCSVVPGEGVSC